MVVKGKHGATLAGRYRLLEQLGEGGMGSVWKAEHLLLHSHVAVKIIDPDVARLEFNLARFLREAKTLATLRSPHVVQVLDFGSDAETPYLVMELLHGQTLGRRLSEQGRLSIGETCRVLQDVCAAMSLVHEQGLIHRDLKPENIFLCNVGGQRVTKVVDFGIAKSLRGDMTASMKTRTGHMLGTPSYMSPEQCRGLKDIDHRADLWALGVIAYECLVGKIPFEGEVLGDLLLRICMDPLPIPSQQARGALAASFDAWFAKAVARDRSTRFQSALELATSLADLARSENAPVREPNEPSRPSVTRISFVPPAPIPRTAPNTETNTSVGLVGSSRRVERRARLAAVAGAVVVAGLGLWAIGNKRDGDVPADVDVQSLRPPYEVTPKVIRPGVPSGRRWLPSRATLPSAQPAATPMPAGERGEAPAANAPGSALAAPSADAVPLSAPASDAVPTAVAPATPGAPVNAVASANPAPAVPAPIAPAAITTAVSAPSPSAMTPKPAAPTAPTGAPAPSVPLPPGASSAPPSGSTPADAAHPAAPHASGEPQPVPRPSHGRQLQPSPPLRPLRGTAAPTPSRARAPQPPGDDTIRRSR
ncbi:MAG TPA: protein kinase [Polyangiaceae bacterium]|nr:protein kinase [Polyangiaceae bacterium]